MPQIAQLSETFASQAFWLLIFFGLVYLVVGRGMLPRILDTVDQRDQQIAGDLLAAHNAREEAQAQERDWRQREAAARERARDIVAAAKADGAAQTAARLAEVQATLDTRLDEAEQSIATARQQALGELERVAAEASRDIVRRLTGAEVAEDEARMAVERVMQRG
ncbi:ATPase [Erythrobacteraceae bacterium CFH 75059]|uniref:F0F1 ATP synthase subunit B family protein n=1 Tax=Qipengyuania thermophila TaxID=2509361 RepID=UPI0010202632|nr:ATPase [Qipengyuania thermophila]TCD05393.1 ATPase [Erythrobacteraceae bacterium CFH 75059]